MASYLSPIGNSQQFFTDAGIVNVGGLLYTYIAGTTTPATTWTTLAQAVAVGLFWLLVKKEVLFNIIPR